MAHTLTTTLEGNHVTAKAKSTLLRREAYEGYLCIAPWLIGLVCLTFGPVVFSFVMSLTRWDMINPPRMVGFANYASIFTDDFRFRQSLKVTAIYAGCAVPMGLVRFLALAGGVAGLGGFALRRRR